MPTYDFICGQGHEQIDVRAAYGARPACPDCGGATEILWVSSFPNIVPDTFPGGSITIENMSAQPETFTSKSEHRRRCKELGIRVRDHHVGVPGTDKSRHTQRWI